MPSPYSPLSGTLPYRPGTNYSSSYLALWKEKFSSHSFVFVADAGSPLRSQLYVFKLELLTNDYRHKQPLSFYDPTVFSLVVYTHVIGNLGVVFVREPRFAAERTRDQGRFREPPLARRSPAPFCSPHLARAASAVGSGSRRPGLT